MKTAKLIIGIISIVLSVVILFQSFLVSIGDAMLDSGETGGAAGIFLAIVLLIAGIIAIATRNGKAGGIVAGLFYIFAWVLGSSNVGTYKDLGIWATLCLIFGIVFILGSILFTRKNKKDKTIE